MISGVDRVKLLTIYSALIVWCTIRNLSEDSGHLSLRLMIVNINKLGRELNISFLR